MKSMRPRRLVLSGCTVVIVLALAVTAAIAGSGALRSGQTKASAPSPNAVIKGGGDAAYSTKIATEVQPFITSSATFVDVPGASVRIQVPAGQRSLIVAEFTAETRCQGFETQPDWCNARILIRGVEANPKSESTGSGTFAFDSTDRGTESADSWEGHAFARSRVVANSGTAPLDVTVKVQARVTAFGTTPPDYWLDDFHLQATAFRAGTGLP